MSTINFSQFPPASQTVLWQGSPSDFASMATGGRIQTAGYVLTEDALRFASGVLSTREEQVPLWAVLDADIQQSLAQKTRGVADLRLTLNQQNPLGLTNVVLKSIKEAKSVRDLILQQANAVRMHWMTFNQQQAAYVAAAGASQIVVGPGSASTPAPTAQPVAGGGDITAQLAKLGEMKESGLLTDAEFTAAKAKALGL